MSVHVVVGASGGIGRAVCAELARRGLPVRAVSRREPDVPGAENVAADATDAAAMTRICAGAAAVYHCVNPPFASWRTAFPEATRALLRAAGAAGARFVFADDTWMYGRVDGPMREDTPVRPVSEKGVLRAWLAEMVLAAHARHEVEVVIGRAPELWGPGVESLLGAGLFAAASRGATARWPGDPDLPMTAGYAPDVGAALVDLALAPTSATGRVWHTPVPPASTGREFVGRIAATAGRPVRLGRITPAMVAALRVVSPVAREGAQLLYQFSQPFLVDDAAFRSAFPTTATSWEEGIAATLAWYRAEPERTRRRLVPV
ncbi:NAD-dependent epimerase/dehydratase family protein [Actinomycetospora termitidis]|uniref:NAD-dependent epimerase/dehydratase family protein n=1 Tax=Actinomycetospora termitidis TaxID=3053470 RepID=A0ABT7MC48_9PSEU|nr:NAD-dependent epimerase/dehydratase family protein [Actinomycetospora sp. Odt1-22]MDL5158243.1 NAD-dependent epimerase/dehydratase family protein [Actinomycetospora sp. Odt1-22]